MVTDWFGTCSLLAREEVIGVSTRGLLLLLFKGPSSAVLELASVLHSTEGSLIYLTFAGTLAVSFMVTVWIGNWLSLAGDTVCEVTIGGLSLLIIHKLPSSVVVRLHSVLHGTGEASVCLSFAGILAVFFMVTNWSGSCWLLEDKVSGVSTGGLLILMILKGSSSSTELRLHSSLERTDEASIYLSFTGTSTAPFMITDWFDNSSFLTGEEVSGVTTEDLLLLMMLKGFSNSVRLGLQSALHSTDEA